MTVYEIISILRSRDIRISLEADKLKVRSTGDIGSDIVELLKAHKQQLIDYLQRNAEEESYVSIPTAEPKPYYPVSSPQKRLYILQQLDPASTAYNMPMLIRLENGVSKEKLGSSFSKLIERHESLRTSFEMVDGMPVQKIHEQVELEISEHLVDAGNLQDLQVNFVRPFELNKAPLCRVGYVKLEDGSKYVLMDMHHIITDGVSQELLAREFQQVYNGDDLPLLTRQYKDYSEWMHSDAQKATLKAQETFWQHVFSGELPVMELPYDFPRPAARNYNGAGVSFRLNKEECAILEQVCKEHQVTLYMVLLSVMNIWLSKLTGLEDIIVGSPIAARKHADMNAVMGMFINTIALRNRPSGEKTYSAFLREVKEHVLGAFENQEYGFENLIEKLAIGKPSNRNPLFDVTLVLQNQAQVKGAAQHDDNGYAHVKTSSKFDMTLEAVEDDQGILLDIVYSTALFREETINRFISCFRNIVHQLTDTQRITIKEIAVLSETERSKLVHGQDANVLVSYAKDKTIIDLFEEKVAQFPLNEAVVFEDKTLTYSELNETANRLAHFLASLHNVVAGDIVGIKLERSEWLVIGVMGILKAGAAYLPIDPAYPQERVDYMISDSQCKYVIDDETLEQFALHAFEYSPANPGVAIHPKDLIYVIYTSGTTGKPKGTLIEHENVVRLFMTDSPLFDFNEKDTWTVFHSICFDFSVWEIFGALLYGGKLVMVPSMIARDPAAFALLMRKQGVTVLSQTPSAFYKLIKQELEQEDKGLSLRYVVFGGEALSPGRLQEWKSKYPATRLINMYGITETTVHVTYKEITDREITAGISNIGKPIPTLSCYVLNQHGQLQPTGVPGELFVGGPGVARGYLNREELTSQRFIASPFRPGERLYRSGDLVKLLDNGEMEYLGRIDHQVKVRGFRIELGEIENALLRIEGVKEAIVLVIEEAEGDKSLAAYLVAQTALDVLHLRMELAKHLPDHMIPSYYIQLDEIPLTSNGKADKSALRKLYKTGIKDGVEYVAPRNELEQQLVAAWEEVLDKKPIGIRHGFFELGGDSIKILRLAGYFKTKLGLEIAIADIYKHNTIEELSHFISSNEQAIQQRGYELHAAATVVRARFNDLKNQVLTVKPALANGIEDIYPMSAIEKGMVFESVINEGVGVYHDQVFFKKHFPDFNIGRFRQALRLMVAKHPILRTSFNIVDFEEEVQIVHANADVVISFVDLSTLTTKEQEQRIEEYMSSELKNPFKTSVAPLWRMTAFDLGRDVYGFVWQFHHAILDGWSNASFLTELNNLYITLGENTAYVPSPLGGSYKDYIIQSEIDKQDQSIREFWKNELADHTRLNIFAPEDTLEEHVFTLESSQLDKLSKTAMSTNIPVKIYSLSAYMLLLKLLNYGDEVVAGLVTNTRPDTQDGDKILGCFLNTVPLKLAVTGHEKCQDYVQRLNKKLIELKKYDRLGLLEISQIHNNSVRSGNPFFDVMFNYVDFHVYKDVKDKPTAASNGHHKLGFERTNTWLDFTISETGGTYNGNIKLNKKLSCGMPLQRLGALYLQILNYIIDNPAASLGKMELTDSQESSLLQSFNNTAQTYPFQGTITAFFEQQVKRTPSDTAIVCGDKKISYETLNKQVNRMVIHLRTLYGVVPGNRIGIRLHRSEWMIVSLLAILKSGAAYVPLDPQSPQERLAYMMEDSGCKAVIDEDCIKRFRTFESVLNDANPVQVNEPNDLAYIMYTSGTTGKPKGVRISHSAVVDYIQTLQQVFGMNEHDVVLQQTSVSFDVSVGEIFGTLCSGGTMVIATEGARDIEKLVQLIEKEKISYISTTPLVVNELNRYAERLRNVRAIVSAGEELKAAHITNLVKQTDVYNAYGPTEITVLATQHKVQSLEHTSSIGYTMPNHNIYIVSDALQMLPPGVPGEICIAGKGLAEGYQNNKELTSEKFVDSPFVSDEKMYRTGDIGYWMPDGKIAFCGRKDEQVKIRGYRIEIGEIENALKNLPEIDAVAVIVKQYSDGSKSLIAYIATRAELKTASLHSYLKNLLPDYMVPALFVQVDKLPLNTSGKIDKRALANMDGAIIKSSVEFVAARNKDEKYLVSLWAEVLKMDESKIGVHDSFFEVGGDSIKILKVFSRLQDKGYEKISVASLFQYPTISKLAEYLAADDNVFALSEEAMADSMDVLNNSISLLLKDE